jgi:hypothetical protein
MTKNKTDNPKNEKLVDRDYKIRFKSIKSSKIPVFVA